MSDAREPMLMNNAERDAVDTQLCKAMCTVGEAQASLLLARLALLLLEQSGDARAAMVLIEEIAKGLPSSP